MKLLFPLDFSLKAETKGQVAVCGRFQLVLLLLPAPQDEENIGRATVDLGPTRT